MYQFNKPKQLQMPQETTTLDRLKNKSNNLVIFCNAVESCIILDKIMKVEQLKLVGISIKIDSHSLRQIYMENGFGVVLQPGADPTKGNMSPSDYMSVSTEIQKAITSKACLFLRIKLAEEVATNENRFFEKTGNHIVSALLDCRIPGSEKLMYYCPVGGGCALDLSPFLTKPNGEKIPVICNTRQDQSLEDDGYCALYNHSMMLAQMDILKTSNELEMFPENSQETMFDRVAKSFEEFDVEKKNGQLSL